MTIAPLRKKYLGEILLTENLITREQLRQALAEQQETKERLGAILLKHGFVSEPKLLSALSVSYGLPLVKLSDITVDNEALKLIPEKMARKFSVVPLEKKGDVLQIAMVDPSNVVAVDEIEKETNLKLSIVLSSEQEIKEKIQSCYAGGFIGASELAEGTVEELNREDLEGLSKEDLEAADAAPVIKYVNALLFEAVNKRASDIHIEPGEKGVFLRMRFDGSLRECPPPPQKYFSAIISRVKIMANLDIGERRLPQDGKCKIKVGDKKIDVRVSTLPTLYGEKVVMRVLDRTSLSLSLDDIGFSDTDAARFKEALMMPYGMVLVTGPTGSGKTTTLYTGLHFINTPDKNIVTAEDPVEYELEGINQVQVKPAIGLTFANILRSVLRQDPDIIMVGEIRDKETAEIAIQAALTGHLVLSTLHTNDAASSLTRLNYMGIEPFLVADAVQLVMAQRLVRRICPNCKKEQEVPPGIVDKLHLPKDEHITFYYGEGCDKCFKTGYRGRIAISETIWLSPGIKKLIMAEAGDIAIKELALKEGTHTLRDQALDKLREGVTTIDEVLTVTMAS
jgi:type IV pilus assembly protein PilB